MNMKDSIKRATMDLYSKYISKEHKYEEDESGVAWGPSHQKPSKLVTEMPNYKPSPRPNPIKPRPGMAGPVRYGSGSKYSGPLAGRTSKIPLPDFETLERFHRGTDGCAKKTAADIASRNKRQFEKEYNRAFYRSYERDYSEL